MKAVPSELNPWAAWLSWFSPELQPALAALLQRLAPLLGPLDRPDQDGQDDVDGLGDLRRRGAYQRLLSSEWLLATELPEEFLRRAVNHEHLFLAPRRRATRNGRMFVALFDAGPLQLGAPRVAHVVMWILLARRAAQAGGHLRWGILQVPGRWHEAAEPENLKALLGARCFEHVLPDHLQAWQQGLDALDEAPQEVWRIGSKVETGVSPLRTASRQAGFSRCLDPGLLAMEIRQGGWARSAELELPSASQASRLLQGDFLGPSRATVRQRLDVRVALRPPVLSISGARVALQLLDGSGLLLVQIPPSAKPKALKGKRTQWPLGSSPLGIAFSGKRVSALVSMNGRLSIWNAGFFPGWEHPPSDEFQAPPGTATLLPVAHLQSGRQQRYLVVDRAGRLLDWPARPDGPEGRESAPATCLEENVLGLWQLDHMAALYVSVYAGWLWVHRLNMSGRVTGQGMPVCPAKDGKVLFGGGLDWHRDVGACAVRVSRTQAECWRLAVPLGKPGARERREGPMGPSSMAFQHTDITLPPGWQGVGVAAPGAGRGAYALLALDQARMGVHSHDGERSRLVYAAPSRIHSVTACPQTGVIAMLTEDRQLIVYALADDSLRTITQFGAS